MSRLSSSDGTDDDDEDNAEGSPSLAVIQAGRFDTGRAPFFTGSATSGDKLLFLDPTLLFLPPGPPIWPPLAFSLGMIFFGKRVVEGRTGPFCGFFKPFQRYT
jgi:hypothetical protein